MKERIVVKDEIFADFLIKNKDNHNISANPKVIMDRCIVEKEPTNWEELKELCEDLESKNIFIINAGNCIEFNGLYFWKDGSITTTQNNNDIWATKTNLTPARQWNIIKSLIGE